MLTCTFAVPVPVMSRLCAYFEVRRRTDRVEILPGCDTVESTLQPVWAVLMLGTAVSAWHLEHGWLLLAVMMPILGSICLLTARRNAQLKQSGRVPLVVYPDRRISHRSQAIFLGGEIREVRTFARKRFDETDGYGVAVVPMQGAPVAMPAPFFDDLELNEANSLAAELGRALRTKVVSSTGPRG